MKIPFVLCLALILSIRPVHAWEWKDFKEEMATPFTTDARYPLYAGTLLTTTLAIFEDEVVDPFQVKQIRNRPLGDSARLGDILGQMVPNILYIGGMGMAAHYGDSLAYDRAIGMFKATAYSAGITTVLKYTIREPRPNDNSVKNSFPSGHTTTIFSFSGYVAAEHGWGWGSAALMVSALTAYSRITDNMHRLHDVTAGATIGWVYGWGISKMQAKHRSETEKKVPETFVAPIIDQKTVGVSMFREF